jgi:hypothetical protein
VKLIAKVERLAHSLAKGVIVGACEDAIPGKIISLSHETSLNDGSCPLGRG